VRRERRSILSCSPDEADAEEKDNSDGDKDMEWASASRPLRDFWAEAWNSDEVGRERRALLKGKAQGRDSRNLVEDLPISLGWLIPGMVASCGKSLFW
jgi:hypothetical protein